MPKKNEFKLDVVSVRLVKDAPIYSERPFNSPYEVVMAVPFISEKRVNDIIKGF